MRPGSEQAVCIICGSSDVSHLRQTIAGLPRNVCKVCASFGALVGRARMQPVLHCLHLVAMEIERELQGDDSVMTSRELSTWAGIKRAFAASAYRNVCSCAACAAADPPGEVNLFMIDGQDLTGDFLLSEHALQTLRHMSPRSRVAAPDGRMLAPDAVVPLRLEANRQATEMPDEVRARMQDRADTVPPNDWRRIGHIAGLVGRQDHEARRHWAMISRYGAGHRDGDFWITRDGCVIPLTDAEKAFPMTRADLSALRADKERAAAWRVAAAPPLNPEGWEND